LRKQKSGFAAKFFDKTTGKKLNVLENKKAVSRRSF
jgi:hypothetical protein